MDQTAKEQVLKEIAALEQQIAIYTAEVDEITSTDPLDGVKYAAVKAELETAQSKLDAKRSELATIEDAGIAAQEKLTADLDAIDIGGETVSLRALVPDEASYQLLYIWLQQREVTNAQIMAALKSSYESQIEEHEHEIAELQELRQDVYKLQDKCTDLEAKRDAAANQIHEHQEEIARLKADNDNLRQRLEDSAKPKETTEDAKEVLERWKNSRPTITNKRWKDDRNKTEYIATLVSTGEEITIGWLNIGGYREVSEAEAESFRTEKQPDAESQADVVPDTTLGGSDIAEPPVIQFPEAVPGTVQTTSPVGTVVLSQEEITRRLLALEKRVEQIEGSEAVA